MAQARRRLSYVIPPPVESVPRLRLPPYGIPRLGSTAPILLPVESPHARTDETPKWARHPRHRLGVASLALDTSTQLTGRSGPEGILYSGGRDGLVISWDLGIQMKKRKSGGDEVVQRPVGRWEIMTGWADDVIDEEAEDVDERLPSDGDVLGDVLVNAPKRRQRAVRNADDIPYEQQWETDLNTFKPGAPSHFRQCAQAHTDWVNDILLCNYNQTVVSASSDGTIKAWNPHSTTSPDPSTIGSHSDYVRCLSYCREQKWVASGSFDRTIKLWDLTRSSQTDPLVTLNPPDAMAPKSSVYALASDPYGHAIASGSPERVIRMWDPRSGKRTGKLVGHTDNIRAILMSDDSRYLLTGSADASIKLWSLASQRCLHTFTHHTDSVWSLYSSHPSLEVFYSGDRSGLVCKVDVEDCADVSEGECMLLCQDNADHNKPSSEGINKIVAMDDNLLWTASGNSSIKRWRVPQRRTVRARALITDLEGERNPRSESPVMLRRRANTGEESTTNTRPSTDHGAHPSLAPSMMSTDSGANWSPSRDREADTTLYGIPFESLVRMISPNEPVASYMSTRGRDPEVATLYSAASVMSVPRTGSIRPPVQAIFQSGIHTSPIRSSRTEDTVLPPSTARADYEERELAGDAVPLYSAPDEVIKGDHGLVRSIILNDRIHALTVDTVGEVAVWDIVRGVCRGRFMADDVAAASQCCGGSAEGGSGSGERERSPREALEVVRERIEGEAAVSPWAAADTKAGVLAIHMNERSFEAEVYADEVGYAGDRHFNDESKLNVGRWVLRNLFIGFIRAEQRSRRSQDGGHHDGGPSPSRSDATPEGSSRKRASASPDSARRPARQMSTTVVSSPKMVPVVFPAIVTATATRPAPLQTALIPIHPQAREHGGAALSHGSRPPQLLPGVSSSSNDVTPVQRARSGTLDGASAATPVSASKEDYFSARARQVPPALSSAPPAPEEVSGPTGLGKAEASGAQRPGTPVGLMGRLMSFGKSKRPVSEAASPVLSPVVVLTEVAPAEDAVAAVEPDAAKTPLHALLSSPLTPPSSIEAPLFPLPSNITILISEEASPSYTTLYRGTVSNTHHDVHALEEAMPMWLLECLLLNKIPASSPQVKISFVLLPWPHRDPDGEQLPELLNTTQSKLTANRTLRVRKLVLHVQEKLDMIAQGPPADEQQAAAAGRARPRAEDSYEILCNEVLLPLDMSLAAIRQYVWRQSSELTMHYRRKVGLEARPR